MSKTEPAQAGESVLPEELHPPAPPEAQDSPAPPPEPMPQPSLAQIEANNYLRVIGE